MLNKSHVQIISSVLSVLLLLCLFDMPYGFYELVRFIAMVGFALLAYYENIQKNDLLKIIFICLALLFQPFFKVALGRDLWNIIDVVVAVFLIYLAIKRYRNKTIEINL